MKQEVLSQFDQPWIPVTGLVLFVICFAAYCLWTFKTERKNFYQDLSQIPLNEPAQKKEE
jgi:cbb3-type cytochrome oxidase subunit 3